MLTVKEVAKRMQVDAKTIRRLATKGEIRFKKVGQQMRFAPDWIEEFINGNEKTMSEGAGL